MSTTTKGVSLSEAAARRVYELISLEGKPLKLRVYITGGGCSGFQYGFAFDEVLRDDDQVTVKQIEVAAKTQTVEVVVDALSLMYLTGAQIDYKENLQGSYFTVKNPNAQTTCSCGASFAL